MNMLIPKQELVRDKQYREFIKSQPCIITGMSANEVEAVDPAHIGTAGKGLKSSDDEILPLCHSLHQKAHQEGEMSLFRQMIPNWLLRAALRAYAREQYREWKDG